MNVLLLAMPDAWENPCMDYRITNLPSIALPSIAGNIEGDHEIKILDLIFKRKNVRRIIEDVIYNFSPSLVGLSCMSFQYVTAIKIAKLIKNIDPRIKIVLGGYHSSLMYQEISKSPESEFIDFIIRGEGEFTFKELLQGLDRKLKLNKIPGLSFKKNNKFIHNSPRALSDLKNIKLPNRDCRIDDDSKTIMGIETDSVETSRGCTNACKFCSITCMYGRTFRKYKIERVIQDLKDVRARNKKQVFFVDDNITLDVKRFERLCDEIIKNGLNDISYIVQVSSRGISSSENLVRKMAKAGFHFVFLGIENMNENNLLYLNKGNIIKNTTTAIKYLKDNDIFILGGTIVGNPEDDEISIRQNFEILKKLNVGCLWPQVLTPYPKTILRQEMLKDKLVVNENDFSKYTGCFTNVRTNHLSAEELDYLYYKYSADLMTSVDSKEYLKLFFKYKYLSLYDSSSFINFDVIKLFIKRFILNKILLKFKISSHEKEYEKFCQRRAHINDFDL
jgi:radical SAM superfamily enzyme YgiQ (UPF0313 family)